MFHFADRINAFRPALTQQAEDPTAYTLFDDNGLLMPVTLRFAVPLINRWQTH